MKPQPDAFHCPNCQRETKGENGVINSYLCDPCYRSFLRGLSAGEKTNAPADLEALARECFTAARLAYRKQGPLAGVPGMLLKLEGNNEYVYEDVEEFIAELKEEGRL